MKSISILLISLSISLTLQCESSKKQQPEIVSGKRKLIQEPKNLKSKSYLPITVVWDLEEEIQVGRETLVRLNILSGDVSEDVKVNISLPPELALTKGENEISLGNFSAGESKQIQIAILVRTIGNFNLGANISRMELGERKGFSKIVSVSTAEKPVLSSKPERTVQSPNGESYYILPEGQTEVISGK